MDVVAGGVESAAEVGMAKGCSRYLRHLRQCASNQTDPNAAVLPRKLARYVIGEKRRGAEDAEEFNWDLPRFASRVIRRGVAEILRQQNGRRAKVSLARL